ncbi:MAG TPA: vWA domain-containing protein, partial [Lacipirellula sp.]
MFEHSLAFDRPAYLVLLLLIPGLWWLGYRSLAGLGRVRRFTALTLRSLVVLLIVFALADVQYQRRSEGLTVVYLLDQSLSIPPEQRELMIDYVRNSIGQHRNDGAGDRFAVIVFGRDAEVEVPPVSADEALHGRVESILDPEY